jgi:hypothetical protein
MILFTITGKSNCFPSQKIQSKLTASVNLSNLRLFSTDINSGDDSDNSSNSSFEETKKHTIRWETSNGKEEFVAFEGETLRTAALRRGIVSPHNGRAQLVNCRGLGKHSIEKYFGNRHPIKIIKMN